MATNWVTIAKTDLYAHLNATQVAAITGVGLAAGEADPFNDAMPSVISNLRMHLRGRNRITLSATANSVPPELQDTAIFLILEHLQKRIPNLNLSEGQKAQLEDARKDLELCRQGELAVTMPTDPDTTTVYQGVPAAVSGQDSDPIDLGPNQ